MMKMGKHAAWERRGMRLRGYSPEHVHLAHFGHDVPTMISVIHFNCYNLKMS